jgi:hypothetical protein
MSNSERLEALIKAAQEWADGGVPVFPVKEDKAPLTANGFHDAVTSPSEVRSLFEFYGDAAWGIGGAMGNGIFAVDVDLYKSNDVKTWFNARIEDGSLPETRTHQTKSGGLHLIYEGTAPDCKPVNGVEVKSDGGYIVLPGSPNYKVLQEGIKPAPKQLLETLRYAAVASRGSTLTQLEAQVLSGADFHNSLAQISSKLAAQGKDQIEIQAHMLKLLNASSASNAGHERHARWRTVMADKGGELSRLAASAYRKFNDDAINDEFGELDDLSDLAAVDDAVFTSVGNDVPLGLSVLPADKWPYGANEGYFAHTDLDITSVEFNMHPIYVQNETVVMFAEPKMGKTAICLTTCLHMACGMDLGPLKVHGQGAVIYYALEGQHAINLRVEAWKREMRNRGKTLPASIPLFTVTKPANFIKEANRVTEASKIIAAAKYAANTGLPLKAIVLDTLTKAMSGGDQNSVEDTSHLFEIVSLVREAGVTATIIFVHHKARQGHVRGSSNIEAEPDMLLDITKKGDVIKMKIARARSIEDGATFHFNISSIELGTTTQGHPLRSMFVEPMDNVPDVVGDGDYGDVAELVQRRGVVTQLGKNGYVTAVDVVAGWHQRQLIKGKGIRGGIEAVPPLTSAPVKEALAKVAADAGGTIFGDYIIRPVYEEGDVTGFKVLVVN